MQPCPVLLQTKTKGFLFSKGTSRTAVVSRLEKGSPWNGSQRTGLSEKEMKQGQTNKVWLQDNRQTNVNNLTLQSSFPLARVLLRDEFFDALHVLVHVISGLAVTAVMEYALDKREERL